MRAAIEIVERYHQQRDGDVLGFVADVLLPHLPVDDVREFMDDDADLSAWELYEPTTDAIHSPMRDYMPFAWEKATGHRGISAERSVVKFREWLWLLGNDELMAFADDHANYAQYGVPVLKRISEEYKFAVPEGSSVERMAKGLPCMSGCREGCGV